MSLDLHSYVDKFAAVCDRKFDRQYDLDQLEKRLAIHRDGKYFLTAKDVACLFDDDATPFAKYWPRAALVRIASEELFAFRSTLSVGRRSPSLLALVRLKCVKCVPNDLHQQWGLHSPNLHLSTDE